MITEHFSSESKLYFNAKRSYSDVFNREPFIYDRRMNFDIVTTVILSLMTLWLFMTNILKTKSVRTADLFTLLFFLAVSFIIVLEYYFFSQSLNFSAFLEYRSTTLIFIHSVVLACLGLLSIQSLDSKKLKTLWRVPLIGLLVGLFSVKFDAYAYISLGLGLITFFVYFINRKRLRVLKRLVLVHSFCIFGLVLIEDYQFWPYNLVLIVYLININEIWDMIKLKQKSAQENI